MYGLRIVLADPDPVFRKHIKEKLINAGHLIIGEAADGRKALQVVFNTLPDLAIMNMHLPGRSGLEVAKIIDEHRVAPVILITEPDKQDDIIHALGHWNISYILKPVDEINLYPAIEVCGAVFKRIRHLEEINQKLKQILEKRKTIDRAKGLLIEAKGMTEQQAYKYIQQVSMDKCLPVQNVAKQIIKALEGNKAKR
ncbi:MAG: response regulator [Firmicutes bacterium HGW-Firmicutes-14]|jgi:response regulator NasT|nr:MAG: response regulator [Firmicutes bacterium HGW-Firmicutes-14]